MITIIRKLLIGLEYTFRNTTYFTFDTDTESIEQEIELYSFVSNTDEGTCILICCISESDFMRIDDDKLIIEIASEFRKSDTYVPEMDKNTSLIICIKNISNTKYIFNKQRCIEDNPYYFKKYVLVYTEQELNALKKYLEIDNNEVGKLSDYIYNKDIFNEYKINPQSQILYNIILNIITKIPIIPLNSYKSQELFNITEHFLDKFDKIHSQDKRILVENLIQTISDYSEENLQNIEKIIDFARDTRILFEGEEL